MAANEGVKCMICPKESPSISRITATPFTYHMAMLLFEHWSQVFFLTCVIGSAMAAWRLSWIARKISWVETRDGIHFSSDWLLIEELFTMINVTYFHCWDRAVVDHANRVTVGTWLDHPRKPPEPSPLLCFRRFFCALIWTWSIFAFFRMRFRDKICMVEEMSSRIRRLQREM